MKKFILIFLLSILMPHIGYCSPTFSDWKLSINGWFADGSYFDQQPGPDAIDHIWGDLPTNFYTLKLSKSFYKNTNTTFSLGKFYMLANWIFLQSDTFYTDFNGEGTDIKLTFAYRFNLLNDVALDLDFGYHYVQTTRRYFNQKDSGTTVCEGNWGNENFNYHGPTLSTYFYYWFIPELAFFGKLSSSPLLSAKSQITTENQGTINKQSSGLRFGSEFGINYAPLKPFILSGGYRYEDLYFHEPTSDPFFLHIIYKGVFLETNYIF